MTLKIRKKENNDPLPMAHVVNFVKKIFQILILRP